MRRRAVVRQSIDGKQYLVTEGDTLYVEKLDNEVNSDVKFNEVLYVDGKVGTPEHVFFI